MHFEDLVGNRPEIMRRLHKINYAKIFGNNFKVESIDKKLKELEIDEQLCLLDHVIDYVYYNFRDLSDTIAKK